MKDTLRIGFHGGAGTVTGSRHLIEAARALLVDCGLFQGLKALRLLNWQRTSFDPTALDAVLLTHTHVDHVAYLPRLVREGFAGPVRCTPATEELAAVVLRDAAHLQEEDAEYANRKGFSKHQPALPLYTRADAEDALRLFRPADYEEWMGFPEGIRARFVNAGHILGSAMVEVRVPLAGREISLVLSGDVGRYAVPLHPDPKPLPATDVLVVESTYGDRLHDRTPFVEQLAGPLRETLGRRGTVLIPAFAVARVQVLTRLLREAIDSGAIPQVPVHVDSPMAVDASKIYARHVLAGEMDPEVVADGRGGLFPRNTRFHRTTQESKELNNLPGPRIIISASGMMTNGRVLHHLERLLPRPENMVLLVGFQAEGTRGRELLDGATSLKMHGTFVPVRARKVVLHGLSAHADREELLRWVRSSPRPPRAVFVVHGEAAPAASFADLLRKELGVPVTVPKLHETFDLAAMLPAV